MSRTTLLVVLGVLALAALGAWIGTRMVTTTILSHVGEQQIDAECTGWTGISDGCRAWAEDVLAKGAPSNTLEIEDVVRVRFDRPALGFGSTCVAEYFLSRYPDEVAWTENVPCPGS